MRLSKSLIATTVLSLLNVGAPATAADLVAKARPVVATAAPSWSGVYFGGQAGYSWANASYTHINTSGFAESMSFHPTSAIGGAHAGLQGQWGSWVLGVEGTFNWTSLDELLTGVLRPPRSRLSSSTASGRLSEKPVTQLTAGCSTLRAVGRPLKSAPRAPTRPL